MSSSGWFFSSNRFGPGGPAYHGGRNDHPAAYDRTAAILTLAALTLYLPFVLSVVTARRRRIPTFLGRRRDSVFHIMEKWQMILQGDHSGQ